MGSLDPRPMRAARPHAARIPRYGVAAGAFPPLLDRANDGGIAPPGRIQEPRVRPAATAGAMALGRVSRSLLAAVVSLLGKLLRELRHRRALRALSEHDDRMLKDVGISRSQIEGAVRNGRPRSALAEPCRGSGSRARER